MAIDRNATVPNPGALKVKANAYKMPFADESFDIIHERGAFDDDVYHHNFTKLLPEVARVLKKGSILLVNDFVQPPREEMEKYFELLGTEIMDIFTIWRKK